MLNNDDIIYDKTLYTDETYTASRLLEDIIILSSY